MPENRVLKLKDKHTIFVRPDSQIANILRVMSVSGEIAFDSFKLFGVGGVEEDFVQYGRVRRLILKNAVYKDVNGNVLKPKKKIDENSGEDGEKGEGEVTNKKEGKKRKTRSDDRAMFSVRRQGVTKTVRAKTRAACLFGPLGLEEQFTEMFVDKQLGGDEQTVKRDIKLADWCIFCLRSGVPFNPVDTPKIYNLGSSADKGLGPQEAGPRYIDRKIFYPSKDIKTRDEKASKYGAATRMIGVLVSPEKMELCFWVPPTRVVWHLNDELSFEGYLKNYFGPHNFGFPYNPTLKYDLLCIAESYELSEQVIFKPSFEKGDNLKKIKLTDSTVFKDLYKDIYVFPRNENGIRQFKFHIIPNLKETLLDFYIRNPQAVADASSCTFQCDAYDKSKNIATVFFYDGCVTKLQSCLVGKSTDYARGENAVKLRIYCFPWQTQYVKDKFAGIKGVTIIDDDYEKVYGIISRRAQKGDGAK